MKKQSAGILLYRKNNQALEVLLAHLGGPFWAKKDEGAWSIPKGEYGESEDAMTAAKREFTEETGFATSFTETIALTPIKQKSGKVVTIFAAEGDCDPSALKSNTFSIEWPPKSGTQQQFPEVDRGEWFSIEEAKKKINPWQVGFLEELNQKLNS